MNNKLSELSKPMAWAFKEHVWATGLCGYVWRDKLDDEAPDSECESVKDVSPLYSQEYVSALLAELERYKQYAKERDAENESLALTVGRLRVELEAKDKRIANLVFEQGGYGYSVLEDLNDKTKRIAELSRLLAYNIERAEAAEKRLPVLEQDKLWLNEIINSEANRADAAEAKLAAPVRLPSRLPDEGYSVDAMCNWARNECAWVCAEAIRAAGFKCLGDE